MTDEIRPEPAAASEPSKRHSHRHRSRDGASTSGRRVSGWRSWFRPNPRARGVARQQGTPFSQAVDKLWRRVTRPFRWLKRTTRAASNAVKPIEDVSDKGLSRARRTSRFVQRSIKDFFKQRSLWHLVEGVPAVVIAMGAVVAIFAAEVAQWYRVPTNYKVGADRAFNTDNFATAALCFARLEEMGPLSSDQSYKQGLTYFALGDGRRAYTIMNRLAPPTKQGYWRAHLWEAQQVLAMPRLSPQDLVVAKSHLTWVLQSRPSTEAHEMIGNVYYRLRDWEKAKTHFLEAEKDRPDARLMLAKVYVISGDRDAGQAEAEKAYELFRVACDRFPDQTRPRMRLADAAVFLEKFSEAAEVLDQGFALTGNEEFHLALAQVYVLWADKMFAKPGAPVIDGLRLLQKAMETDPDNMDPYNRLIGIVSRQDEKTAIARVALQETLARGQAAWMSHLLLGVDAWQRGEKVEALQHVEQANRLRPRNPAVGNTLAWFLANAEPPDLPRALEMIEMTLQQWPNHPESRDTRGQILAKMGRHQEALLDLQFAVAALPGNPEVHRALANVYEQLKIPSMAAKHRSLADAAPKQPR